MRSVNPRLCGTVLVLALLHAVLAHGQWDQRTITLNPGWNAVFLPLQPEPKDPATVFAGLPIDSVWTYNRRADKIQFIRDATELRPTLPNWMVYVPAGRPETELTNLFAIFSGRAYLIKVSGAAPVQWVIRGRVKNRPIDWEPDAPSLVGFSVDPAAPPTYAEFFAPSAAHAGQPIYDLKADGQWVEVANPNSERILSDRAYWVMTKGNSEYQGPLTAEFSFGMDVSYGIVQNVATLVISNRSSVLRNVQLVSAASLVPPTKNFSANLGEIPLRYKSPSLPMLERTWQPLSGPLEVAVPAQSRLAVELEVRRSEMADAGLPAGYKKGEYQNLLYVSDDHGTLLTLGMTADGLSDPSVIAKALSKGVTPPGPRTGLWVGNVEVSAVSQPTAVPPILEPVPVPYGHEFQYRILLHVDAAGAVRLLSHVTFMRHTHRLVEIPDELSTIAGATRNVIDVNQPGYNVLITDTPLLSLVRADDNRSLYEGTDFRGDTPVGKRLATMAFQLFRDDPENGLNGPGWIRLNGQFPSPIFDDGTFSLVSTDSQGNDLLVLPFDDPHNPFIHQFHPDHDSLDADFLPYSEGRFPASPPGEGVESYTITRRLTFGFTKDDPMLQNLAGYGDNVLGGIFEEEISGIFAQEIENPIDGGDPPFITPPLKLSGIFRLERVTDVPALNDPDANVNDPDAF